MQRDLFGDVPPYDPIIGVPLLVRSGEACFPAVVAPGKGPHALALKSVHGKHICWLSKSTADFIREMTRCFGASGEPLTVCVRHKTPRKENESETQ